MGAVPFITIMEGEGWVWLLAPGPIGMIVDWGTGNEEIILLDTSEGGETKSKYIFLLYYGCI